MLRPRIIPCLLIHNGGLVKTKNFKEPKYVGDPINAVRIFNEKESDELMVLDIDATAKKCKPNFELITKLAAECRMPLCYGGGITTAEEAIKLVDLGVEKIAISSAAIENPDLLTEISSSVGVQSVVAVIDVHKSKGLFSQKYDVYSKNATIKHKTGLKELLQRFEKAGAGEIVVNSIDKDGLMNGYDIELAKEVKKTINIPFSFLGGCGNHDHISALIEEVGLVGACAGSLFVFKGKYKAVLINYPFVEDKIDLCDKAMKNYLNKC